MMRAAIFIALCLSWVISACTAEMEGSIDLNAEEGTIADFELKAGSLDPESLANHQKVVASGICDIPYVWVHITDVIRNARYAGVTNCNELKIAGAIAIAESNRHPTLGNSWLDRLSCNVNPNGSVDRGVWQINSINLSELNHPTCATTSNPDGLYTLNCNAKYMYYVRGRQGWSAWYTYTGGQYQQFCFIARNAVNDLIDRESICTGGYVSCP